MTGADLWDNILRFDEFDEAGLTDKVSGLIGNSANAVRVARSVTVADRTVTHVRPANSDAASG